MADDPATGLAVLARALVRGQGKTEGFFERRIPISMTMRRAFGRTEARDAVAACANDRMRQSGDFARRVLFPAALAAFTGAPRTDAGERARDDDANKSRAGRMRDPFDRRVDDTFFAALDEEVEEFGDPPAAARARAKWLLGLGRIGRDLVDRALEAAPGSSVRRWRTRVRAHDVFTSRFERFLKDEADPDALASVRSRADGAAGSSDGEAAAAGGEEEA